MSAVSPLARTATLDAQTAVEMPFPPRGRARIEPAWGGADGTLGGFVAVVALRAMQARIDDGGRRARSLSMHYLAVARGGEAEVDTMIEREGGSRSTTSARVRQGGRPIALARATFALEHCGPLATGVVMPDVPAPRECEPLPDRPAAGRAHALVERRPVTGAPAGTGRDGGGAATRTWMRLAEGREVDLLGATLLADAGPSAAASPTRLPAVRAVELAVQFAPALADAGGEWVLSVAHESFAGGGYVSEDGAMWSEDGELLLVARRLRAVRAPSG